MFKINKLTFISTENEEDGYQFTTGLNYFESGNNTGKTEFYKMLDYMFGDEQDLSINDCYKDCVSKILIEFEYNNLSYTLIRTLDLNINYIYETLDGFDSEDILSHEEYRNRLNTIFTVNEKSLRDLRDFAEEDIGFRTFTMFNFLDENTQGKIQDFLSKCDQTAYSIKLNTILNFIFNKNLAEIKGKEDELRQLQRELDGLESSKGKSEFILNKINSNLKILAPNAIYNGSNILEIKTLISEIKSMNSKIDGNKGKDISELEVMYNSLSEQIKKYKNEMSDMANIKKYDQNRKKLLSLLRDLVKNQNELSYLVDPIESLLTDLDEGISFGNYILKDETVKKLEKQLEGIKVELQKNDSKFEIYSLSEKEKAIAVIEEYIDSNVKIVDEDEIEKIRKNISKLKREIHILQNTDDISAINNFSKYITDMYLSLVNESSFAKEDSELSGFSIKYLKRGNVLQPVRIETEKETEKQVERNYYPGSMARHITIQLCGYAAFLNKLIKANKYPLIPIFVIDHISKPFDTENCKAVGIIIRSLLKDVGEENLQIFMFDSENAEKLGIDEKYSQKLVIDIGDEKRSGFCPFFKKGN